MSQQECVTAIIRFPAQHCDEGREILRHITERARQDAGCLRFVAYEDREKQGVFTLNEEWSDAASLHAHLASDHVQATFAAIEAIDGQIVNHWCHPL